MKTTFKPSTKLTFGLVIILLGILFFQAVISNTEISNSKLRKKAQNPEALHKILTSGAKLYDAIPLDSFSIVRIQKNIPVVILKGESFEVFFKKSEKKYLTYDLNRQVLTINSEKNQIWGEKNPIYLFMPQAPKTVIFEKEQINNFQDIFCYVFGFDHAKILFINDACRYFDLKSDASHVRIYQYFRNGHIDFTPTSMDSTSKIKQVDLIADIQNSRLRCKNNVAQLFNAELQVSNGSFNIQNAQPEQKIGTFKINGTLSTLPMDQTSCYIGGYEADSLILNLTSKIFMNLDISKSLNARYQSIQCDSTIMINR